MLGSVVALALALAGTGELEPPREPAAARDLRAAADAAQKGDCRAAIAATAKVKRARDFLALPDELKLATWQISGLCLSTTGGDPYPDLLAATAMPDAMDEVWRFRLGIELDREDLADAVATVEALARGRGAVLNAFPTRFFYQADRRLKSAGETALRRRFLAVLAADDYHPDEPGQDNQGFRSRYATVLIEAREPDAAFAVARRIDHPALVIEMSLDPRFRALYPQDPDLRAITTRRLAEAREIAMRHPDHIAPVTEITFLLRTLGRPREAIAALEAIRARVADGSMADHDDRTIWWWDELSRAHRMLGEDKAAVAALLSGGALREAGGANVSQVINLAQLQSAIGDPAAALATLAPFAGKDRSVSPYGAMQVAWTRGCALARLGRAAEGDADLAFVRAHAADAPDALTALLLCRGDADGAAASLVARLADPDQRVGALRDLSDFDDPVAQRREDPNDAALAALARRPDVAAAIVKAGGVRRFNVQPL